MHITTIFSYPDCDRRLWNFTKSTKRLVGYTTGEDLHLALKIILNYVDIILPLFLFVNKKCLIQSAKRISLHIAV